MIVKRASLIAICALSLAGCGGAAVSPPPPPPPEGGIGAVSGAVAITATSLTARPASALPGPYAAPLRRGSRQPTYVPNVLLVKPRPGLQAIALDPLHRQVRGTVDRTIPRIGVQIVRLAPGASAEGALAAYRASPHVQYAERDAYAYLTAVPNDQYYSLQWHYPAINLPLAWDTIRGSSVIVAVLDSGIRSHPDLDGITVQGWDFLANDSDPTDPGCSSNPDEFSHGMHVSGTIAALTNNSGGVAGVNWGGATPIKIMPIRVGGEVSGTCGVVLLSAMAEGLIFAADHGAKVVNMSLGGPVDSTTVQDAVNYAAGLGVTMVAAAGNDGGPVLFPAAYANVIAVGATDCANNKASYSNVGPELDLVAPGGDLIDCTADGFAEFILSTSWSPSTGNVYLYSAGTSMAAPHVAGVAALLIGRGITGPAAIQSRLESTATDLGAAGKDNEYGSGLVNAAAAVGIIGSRLCAFSGLLSGATISRGSDVAGTSDTGAFTVSNAESGIRSLFAWQDFDNSGTVTPGDIYGQTDGVSIYPNQTTTGVMITTQTRSAGSAVLAIDPIVSCP